MDNEKLPEELSAQTDNIPEEMTVPAEKQPEALSEADESWLDELLAAPEMNSQIQPDDQAMDAVGLTHPTDLELEKILQEDWGTSEPESAPVLPTEQETFKDDEFRAAFGEGEELNQVFSDGPVVPREETPEPSQEEPEEEYEEEVPMQKGRPKRKKGYGLLGIPHLIATCVWLVIIVAIGLSIGRLVWVCASDVLAFGREEQLISLTIDKDDDIDAIAEKLQKSGLIRYSDLFKLYAALAVDDGEIVPGTYELNSLYDYHALVAMMSPKTSRYEEIEVQIPEGYTCAQIFRILEDKGVCAAKDLEAYAADGALDDYWFLEGVTRGDKYCLEGYLFPDTYKFYKNDKPEQVLEKMLNNFNRRFSENMKQKLDTLNDRMADMMRGHGYAEDYIAANRMTVRQVVIVASMIEKETANDLESYSISSVIYNRLTNRNAYPFLNIDATLVYALGGKTDLTEEDKNLDSPYNTYTHEGLIPGPISNPGRASLEAALDPEDTDYHYYALDPAQGSHHFSVTYQEHLDFLKSLEDS